MTEILWGDLSGESELALQWTNRQDVACLRVSHVSKRGRLGIWLLTFGKSGYVRADYPRRFFETNRRAEVTATITDLNGPDPPRFVPLHDARGLARPPPDLPEEDPSIEATRRALLGQALPKPAPWSRLCSQLRRIRWRSENRPIGLAILLATPAAISVAVVGVRFSARRTYRCPGART